MTTNPFPIGIITITSGTPIKLGAVLAAANIPKTVRTLILYNTGTSTIYLGDSTLVKATLVGCIDKIASGERYVVGGVHQLDEIDWESFYVDGDNNGDVLLVSGQTVS